MVALSLSLALLVLGMLLPMGLTLWMLIHAARAATVVVGRCGRCGYDLRGLGSSRNEAVCPECGHPYRVLTSGASERTDEPAEEASACASGGRSVSSAVSPLQAGRRASSSRDGAPGR